MKTINHNTRTQAIQITMTAFIDNPSMNWFLKKDIRQQKRMWDLCAYCVDLAIEKEGAFISEDKSCVCLIFLSSAKLSFIANLKLNLLFINRCCGWFNLFRILKRQNHIKKIRGNEEHLYALLLASDHKCGNQSVIECREFMFQKSLTLDLPIYAETCSPKNKMVYERFGFETYNEFKLPETEVKLWFLKRNRRSLLKPYSSFT